MNNQELEIKILNIDIEQVKSNLKNIGAIFKEDIVQKIYTYDCYDPFIIYELMISDYKITNNKNSLKKLMSFFNQLKRVFNEDNIKTFNDLTGFNYLDEYIENNINNINLSILENNKIKDIIRNTKEKFFKWIRLRQSDKKVEMTVKYIYNVSAEYNIDDVKEIEIEVNDFNEANKLIEELGYYRKKLVEKRRISYVLGDNSIDIDIWPLIPAYLEIEGKNTDQIYDVAYKLGYSKKDIKIMNTEDVYLNNGLDLTSFEILTFSESVIY